MGLGFSDDQLAARELAREVLDKELPTTLLRQAWDEGPQVAAPAWRALASTGLLGLLVPQAHGGAGGTDLDLALVLEEVGRACLPGPFIETAAVAAPVLAASGPATLQARWLPAIAAGEARCCLMLGGVPYIVDADQADLLLIEVDGALYATEAVQARAAAVAGEDPTRRLFTIDVADAELQPLDRGPEALAAARDRATVATAALLNGVSLQLLELTISYVRTRHQFGQPVGGFQAVKHKLASVHALIESSRATTWSATAAIAGERPDRSRMASAAKAAANAAAALANREALQCHGGIGFTWEHDLHMWLKRGKALEGAYGTTREHHHRLGGYLLDGGSRTGQVLP